MPTPKQIFISYARKDGRDLALRLLQDLQAVGYKVWLDSADIGGGDDWSHAIEAEIDCCDIALALLSFGSDLSEICRGEQVLCLDKGKRVIPLLVQPDAPRPVHLYSRHYRDFSDPTQYAAMFQVLLEDIITGHTDTMPPRQIVNTAPPPPLHLVNRPKELDLLRRTVLGDETDSQIALTALEGMGGVGKSVLAEMLCHDTFVQAAFPDGIVWVNIGRGPGTLIEQMRQVGAALGDSVNYYTSDQIAANRLRTILPDKAALIVLDDVWDKRHVEPFLANAPRCRTLFTTRSSEIALALGATQVRLGVLTLDQSVELLRKWVGHDDPALPKIAERLGGLALALKLAGARLREGMAGSGWLASFQHVSQIKLGRYSTDPTENLQVCFDLSVERIPEGDRPLYYTLGIFLENVWIPQEVVTRLWRKQQPKLSAADCTELITVLNRLALIEVSAEHKVSLHDLLHDYTCEKLGDRYLPAQNDLLTAYNPNDLPWPQLRHDGYLYDYLAYHLHEAGRRDELYLLLTAAPKWMEVKFAACTGDTSYMADLDLALRDFEAPFPSAFPSTAWREEGKCSAGTIPELSLQKEGLLILAQLHTARQVVYARVSRYDDTDLKTLVWLGRTQEALSHARLRPEPLKKSQGLLAIHEALKSRRQPDPVLVSEAVEVARGIQDVHMRTKALRDLAAALAQAGRWDESLEVARSIQDKDMRIWALRDLAAALAQAGRWDEAVGVARGIQDTYMRTKILRDLAASLVQVDDARAVALFDEAVDVAHNVQDEDSRAGALRDLAAALAQAERWDEALDAARSIQDAYTRTRILRDLAATLVQTNDVRAAALFDEALDVARSIQDEDSQARVLSVLAVALAQAGRWDEALDVAHSIQHEDSRAGALSDLAASLAQAGRWDETLDVARDIQNEDSRAGVLRDLAIALARAGDARAVTLFGEALDVARGIQDIYTRTWALRALAAALDQLGDARAEALFSEALDVACSIQDAYTRAGALRDLATALAQIGRWDEALEVARSIQGAYTRTWALSALATALVQAGRCDEALEVAYSIQDEDSRAGVLSALVAALAQAKRSSEARDVARDIQDEEIRTWALRSLTTALAQAEYWDEALMVARDIQSEDSLAGTLRDLAAALAQANDARAVVLFDEAVEVARGIQDEDSRAGALRDLAAALAQAGRWDEVLGVARSIQDAYARTWALRDLAAALAQAERWGEALDVARCIQGEDSRAGALCDLATAQVQAGNTQAGALFSEALDTARNVQDAYTRIWAQRDLAAALAQAGRWDEALATARDIQDEDNRAGAQRDLAAALAQAGRWDEALATARDIQDAYTRTGALRDLAAALAQAGRWDEALATARDIQDAYTRTGALRDLAVTLVQAGNSQAAALFDEALDAACNIQDAYTRTWALRALAAALTQAECWDEALDVARSIQDEDSRAGALRDLAAGLDQGGDMRAPALFSEALDVARSIQDVYTRIWALRDLVTALAQTGRFDEALDVARGIQDDNSRAGALRDLAAALAQVGQYSQAFSMLGAHKPDKFVQAMSGWSPHFEQVAPGLSVCVLREMLRILGWEHPGWRKVYEMLSSSAPV